MKKHYETHVEDTDKLISVAGPVMEEQAQRKYGLYTPTSEGDDDDFPSISGIIARYSALGLTNEQMAAYNEETESTSKNLLTIGYSGNDYTKIAFRNLAIYPTVLSKEDCIKAYNYLQTLKAK